MATSLTSVRTHYFDVHARTPVIVVVSSAASAEAKAALLDAHADLDVRVVEHEWPSSYCPLPGSLCWLPPGTAAPDDWKVCKTARPAGRAWDGSSRGLMRGMGGWADSYVHMGGFFFYEVRRRWGSDDETPGRRPL